jgi:hypothetical protein
MVRPLFLLLAILLVICSKGQSQFPAEQKQLLYPTLDDFVSHHQDTFCHLRKVQDVRVDSLVNRCWFTDRDKGMLKDVFAVAYEDQLYVQEQAIRQRLPSTFHPHARKESNCFYPALEQGRYFYFQLLSEDKNSDLSTAMGLMAGSVGNAFGVALTPPQMNLSSVVMDTYNKTFFSFDTWKDIELFMHTYYPNDHFLSGSTPLDHEAVRHLFARLNKE